MKSEAPNELDDGKATATMIKMMNPSLFVQIKNETTMHIVRYKK